MTRHRMRLMHVSIEVIQAASFLRTRLTTSGKHEKGRAAAHLRTPSSWTALMGMKVVEFRMGPM
jgi:hypothetical protein